MLQNVEKMIENLHKNQTDKQYLDIIYDIESFLIDLWYENCESDPVKQSKIGKIVLSEKALEQNEHLKISSKLRPLLRELGIGPQVKGLHMLEMCTLEAVRAKSVSENYYIKDVYLIVSKKFCTTPSNCERLCRYACSKIEFPADFGKKYPYLESLTHRTYEKVTVKELVDALSNYLIYKHKFKSKKVQAV